VTALFGLDVLGVSTLLTLASAGGGGSAVNSCAQIPVPPAVSVQLLEGATVTSATHTVEDLEAMNGSAAHSAYPEKFAGDVGGLMYGHVAIDHEIQFSRTSDGNGGFGCVAMRQVNVTLRVDPTIYIAAPYRTKECLFREIVGHEQHHVDVDRAIAEKYRGRIEDGLRMLFSQPADYSSGVITAADMAGTQKRMEKTMDNAIGVLFQDMQNERARAQHDVDSPAEYARIARTCRGEI
jgi:hypothetical protein